MMLIPVQNAILGKKVAAPSRTAIPKLLRNPLSEGPIKILKESVKRQSNSAVAGKGKRRQKRQQDRQRYYERYYRENRKHILARNRRNYGHYYLENRERILAKDKQYYLRNRECIRRRRQSPKAKARRKERDKKNRKRLRQLARIRYWTTRRTKHVAYLRARTKTKKFKAWKKMYRNRPKVKKWRRAYFRRPDVIKRTQEQEYTYNECRTKFMPQFSDPDPLAREEAAYSLGSREHEAASKPLLKLLKDPERFVRLAAIYALGKIGDMAVAKRLETEAELVAAGCDDAYKKEIRDALASIRKRISLPPVLKKAPEEPRKTA